MSDWGILHVIVDAIAQMPTMIQGTNKLDAHPRDQAVPTEFTAYEDRYWGNTVLHECLASWPLASWPGEI